MGSNNEELGCLVIGAAVLFGGIWAYNNYEIVRKGGVTPSVQGPQPRPPTPVEQRPHGLIEVADFDTGTVWRFDADSVSGSRTARHFWIREDHTRDRTRAARETKTLYRVNCESTAYRTLSMVTYNAQGRSMRILGPEDFADVDRYPPPGSNIAGAISFACHRGYDQPPASQP